MKIKEIQKEIHQNNIEKGFYEGEKNIGEMIALIHSEVSEALEADRKSKYTCYPIKDINDTTNSETFKNDFNKYIKDSFQDELADIIIRVLDLAEYGGVDLEGHIMAKMRYNRLRPFKHGKKY